MKIETSSPFLQVNAVAQRAVQLIRGSSARVRTESRQPTAIALAELRAGSIDVLAPDEARDILTKEAEEAPEEDRAASEAARVNFEAMWPSSDEDEASTEEAGE